MKASYTQGELGGLPASVQRRVIPTAGTDDWARWAELVRKVLFPLMSEPGRRRASELTAVMTVRAVGDALVHTDLGGPGS